MICGISAKSRVGKDTLASYLCSVFNEKYNRHFKLVAFADILKRVCQGSFNLTEEQLWGNEKEVEDKRFIKDESIWIAEYEGDSDLVEYWTPREIMQELGSFYRRIDCDFWIKALDKYLVNNRIEDVIITDVRHMNECEYVKNKQGFLIKITRDVDSKIHGIDHESEISLDNYRGFDITITNNGTLDNLKDAAINIVEALISLEKLSKKGRII